MSVKQFLLGRAQRLKEALRKIEAVIFVGYKVRL
jgi:hypothetical protein